MSRPIDIPNHRREEDPNYTFRAGRVPNSNIWVDTSEGYLNYITGSEHSLIASILIKSIDIPSEPALDIFINHGGIIPWEYLHKINMYSIGFTKLVFELVEPEGKYLHEVLTYYHLLYPEQTKTKS